MDLLSWRDSAENTAYAGPQTRLKVQFCWWSHSAGDAIMLVALQICRDLLG